MSLKKNEPIIILDNNARRLKAISGALKGHFLVIEASTLEEIMGYLKKRTPPLIIAYSVKADGLEHELVKKIAMMIPKIETKIAFYSDAEDSKYRAAALDFGVSEFLKYPVEKEEFLARISQCFDLFSDRANLQGINRKLQEEVDRRTTQIVNAEKLAFIGQHSAQVVHNLKGPIAVFNSCFEMMRSSHPDIQYLPMLEKSLSKLIGIAKTVSDGRTNAQYDKSYTIDLNELIEKEIEVLKLDPFIKYKTKIILNLEEIEPFEGSPLHFTQIFGNLVGNAKNAMVESDVREITVSTRTDKGFAIIEVKDSGGGMTEEVRSKIFESFFAPRDDKPGIKLGGAGSSGLGLAFCYKMIVSYGGAIDCESTLGEGTTFIIRIPMDQRIHKNTDSAV